MLAVELVARRFDLVSQGLEEPSQEVLAAPTGQYRERRFERNLGLSELRSVARRTREGRAEHLRDRHAEKRRSHPWAIVHILLHRRMRVLANRTHQSHRIDIQQQTCGASLFIRLGVEDVRLTPRQVERLKSFGVFVEQKAEISRRLVRCRDREQHVHPPVPEGGCAKLTRRRGVFPQDRSGQVHSPSGVKSSRGRTA